MGSITELVVKHGLRRGHLPDAFTSSLFALSPYRGCGHGCLYCDGRAEKYYVKGDFATDLGVRSNLPELFQSESRFLRERDREGRRSLLSLGSGVTDVYQPLEHERRLTRRCAEILVEIGQPTLVITKSALILRDLDLWSQLAQGPGFVLLMTVAQDQEAHRRRFEPGASSLETRWETLKAFRDAGAVTGVLAMPLLPGISDDEKTIRALYGRAAETGVDYLMAGGLTLRPGRQKDLFLSALKPLSPELLPWYLQAYGEDRPSGVPRRDAQTVLQQRIAAVAQEYQLPFLLPHRIHSKILPQYESLYLLFLQMEEIFADRGTEVLRLRSARERFGTWLTEKRTIFRRNRSFEPTWIAGEFQDLLVPGQLERLLGNERLAAWARQIVSERMVFDPITRKLVTQ